ncbi:MULTISPECIES: hypothetical protein [Bacillus]|uniref:hypothetical protein n=1 Tax=Bacillus TaxID=1386 RepID=UPI0002D3B41D|nr:MULTISPECIES: hypothetical protein [Bacillus]
MTYIIVFFLLVFFVSLYKRYVPVIGVPCKHINNDQIEQSKVIVDLRDYNDSDKTHLEEAIRIPVAYLQRYHHEIPSKNVHIIVNDRIEKNMGIRLLRKKGISVDSYTMSNCSCS